jgi:replicative DNA helicase
MNEAESERQQLERRILYEIILDDPGLQNSASQSLSVADFTDDRDALIFWAVKKVSEEGRLATMVRIRQTLAAASILEFIGGEKYLCELSAAAIIARGWFQ